MKFFAESLYWTTTEDTHKEGAIPGTEQIILSEGPLGTYPSFAALKTDMVKRFGLPAGKDSWAVFSGEKGRIDVQFLADENNHQATLHDVEEWKRGRKRLWLADVSITVQVGNLERPRSDDLARMTGLQEI